MQQHIQSTETLQNLFDKANEQIQARLRSAMARKGGPQGHLLHAPAQLHPPRAHLPAAATLGGQRRIAAGRAPVGNAHHGVSARGSGHEAPSGGKKSG